MTLLDRYIIRQYLTNVVTLFAILFAFAVAIDVSLNFGDFWGMATESLKAAGNEDPTFIEEAKTAVYLVFDYWWPNLLRLFNFMLGLVTVGAMGFTLTQLVRNRELVSMLAGGISMMRIARPILVVGLVLGGLQLANREFVLPRIAPLLARDREAVGQKVLGSSAVPLTSDGQGKLFYAKSFDADKAVLEGVLIFERDENGSLLRRIIADRGTWDAAAGQWNLENGRVDRTLVQTAKIERVSAVATSLDPTQLKLRRFAGYAQSLSFLQLTQMTTQPALLDEPTRRRLAELDRVRFGRFATVLCNILTLVIAMSFYLQREPTNMLRQSLKCAPVAIVSLFGGILANNVNIPGVPAALGVFLPCLILLPVAIAAVRSIRT